jgi:hypothetical protein
MDICTPCGPATFLDPRELLAQVHKKVWLCATMLRLLSPQQYYPDNTHQEESHKLWYILHIGILNNTIKNYYTIAQYRQTFERLRIVKFLYFFQNANESSKIA